MNIIPDKSLEEFQEIIRKNPSDILNAKYHYMSVMFPNEYIKALKTYIDVLNNDLKNIKLMLHIRSKL